MTTATVEPISVVEEDPYPVGIYHDISREQYDAIPALNWSTLKLMHKKAKVAKFLMDHPSKDTDAMRLGAATHVAVLEPEKFDSLYVVAPECRRGTKVWNSFVEDHPDQSILKPAEYNDITWLGTAVRKHPKAAELLAAPTQSTEVTVIWDCEGMLCKSRIDWIGLPYNGPTVVMDLKTTIKELGHRSDQFDGEIGRRFYHEQMAFYRGALDSISPAPRPFYILAVEKGAGHDVAVIEVTEDQLDAGRARYLDLRRDYQWCRDNNKWPGYCDGIAELELPDWAMEPLD